MYLVDCERLREKSPGCEGPVSWEVSERTVRKMREVFRSRNLLRALTLNLTPGAAAAHSAMMREWHPEGKNIGIQPNVPGLRYPKYDMSCLSPLGAHLCGSTTPLVSTKCPSVWSSRPNSAYLGYTLFNS